MPVVGVKKGRGMDDEIFIRGAAGGAALLVSVCFPCKDLVLCCIVLTLCCVCFFHACCVSFSCGEGAEMVYYCFYSQRDG